MFDCQRYTDSSLRANQMKTRGVLSRWAHGLSILEITVRSGSVSAAAACMNMSAKEVSRSLRELENAMDTLLFTRTNGRVGLTPAGEVLHAAVIAGIWNIRECAGRSRPQSPSLDIDFDAAEGLAGCAGISVSHMSDRTHRSHKTRAPAGSKDH